MKSRYLALVLVLAAGCQTGRHPHYPAPSTAAATITDAHARDLVHVGTLSPADLPGWKHQKATASSDDPLGDIDVLACSGTLANQKTVFNGPEIDFTKGFVTISSEVDVAATPALAARDTAVWSAQTTAHCLERDLNHAVSYEGIALDKFRATPVHTTIGGVRVDGFTATMTLTDGQRVLPVTVNVVALPVGHAELYLAGIGIGVGVKAPAVASLVHLLAKTAARVRKVRP